MSIDLTKIVITAPKPVVETSFENQGNVHPISLKSNLLYENNKYLTIVSPKLEVQNVDDRQIELLIARKEKNRGFYNIITSIEQLVTEQCHKNSKTWFNKDLTQEQIKKMFNSYIVRPNSLDSPFTMKINLSDNVKHLDVSVSDFVTLTLKIDSVIFNRTSGFLNIVVIDMKVYPSQTSVEEPAAVPVEEPAAVPVEEPAAVPVEEPTVVSVEEPTVVPVEELAVVPVEEPTVVPVEVPAVVPVEVPAVVPVEVPVVVPVAEPSVVQVDVPVEEPVVVSGGILENITNMLFSKSEPEPELETVEQESDQETEQETERKPVMIPIHPNDLHRPVKKEIAKVVVNDEDKAVIDKLKKKIKQAIVNDDHELAFRLQQLLKDLV